MSIETNKELVRRLVASLNDGRLELLDDVVAPDYRQDNRSVGAGREGLKALFGRLRAAFPDLSVSVDQLVGEADAVVAVTRMRGTQRGDLPGVPASGRTVDVSSIDVYTVADDRIVEHFGRFDELGMLEQLGVAHDLSWPGPIPPST
jgi:steroid delta-isomerase-like uncharacterized protein